MISAVLLLTIGVADVALGLAQLGSRSAPVDERIPGRWWAIVLAALIPALGWWLLGTPPLWALGIAVAGWVWIWLEVRFLSRQGNIAFLTAAVLVVPVVAAGILAERSTSSASALADGFAEYTRSVHLPLSLSLVVGAVAVVVILTRTSNVVCRAAFGRAVSAEEPPPSAARRRWVVSLRARDLVSVTEAPAAPGAATQVATASAPAPTLRGGRMIGPLERILIVALALTGAEAVIVGLLAAKGIVRFPEISADGRRGSKAEEFLVGSLVSWLIAGAAAAYLVVQRIGL